MLLGFRFIRRLRLKIEKNKKKFFAHYRGYDFGYLLKMLTGKLLPDTENDFFELLKLFFPTIYDVKYLMKSCKNLKGGLEEVAKQLEVSKKTKSFSFLINSDG